MPTDAGSQALTDPAFRDAVYRVINLIPAGKVATYGQIATLAGLSNQSRLVGRLLKNLPPGTKLPWHRVINSQGKVSNPDPARQLARLAAEDVTPVRGRISLRHYQWQP